MVQWTRLSPARALTAAYAVPLADCRGSDVSFYQPLAGRAGGGRATEVWAFQGLPLRFAKSTYFAHLHWLGVLHVVFFYQGRWGGVGTWIARRKHGCRLTGQLGLLALKWGEC